MRLRFVIAALCLSSASLGTPLFEPTDLEFEHAGMLDFDFQLGMMRGPDYSWRTIITDFEIDFGLTRNIELNLDGTYAIRGTSSSPFASPQAVPDALWTSIKMSPFKWGGIQLGPKFPVAKPNNGIGMAGLALVGIDVLDLKVVFNTGMLADPRPLPGAPRPVGILAGIDVQKPIDCGYYTLIGGVSTVRYLTDYPHQLLTTAGFQMTPSKHLNISAVVFGGLLGGGDKYGVLLGLSPKMRIFGSD